MRDGEAAVGFHGNSTHPLQYVHVLAVRAGIVACPDRRARALIRHREWKLHGRYC